MNLWHLIISLVSPSIYTEDFAFQDSMYEAGDVSSKFAMSILFNYIIMKG